MNPIINWNTFQELEDMQSRIMRAMNLGSNSRNNNTAPPAWIPSVDISEDEEEYLIKADLPEVDKENVKVTVENGVLAVRGERKFEAENKSRKYHRIERSYGSFTRSLALPDDADASKVTAEFKNGLLRIRLPKSEATKPKQIEVAVN